MTLVSRLCHMSSVRSTSDGRGPVTPKRVPDREEQGKPSKDARRGRCHPLEAGFWPLWMTQLPRWQSCRQEGAYATLRTPFHASHLTMSVYVCVYVCVYKMVPIGCSAAMRSLMCAQHVRLFSSQTATILLYLNRAEIINRKRKLVAQNTSNHLVS